MRALVVDDEEAIRNLLSRVLGRKGWETETAAQDQEALRALNAAHFDVAFVDVNLSDGHDGIVLALELRNLYPAMRVISMSGEPANAARVDAVGLGPLLRKPFDLSAIDALLLSTQGGKNVK